MGVLFGIVSALAPSALTLFIGGICRKIGWLRVEADSSLRIITIRIFYPCFFFYHLVGNTEIILKSHLIYVVSTGFVCICLGFTCAFLVAKLFRIDSQSIRSFVFSTGIFNYGYFAFPVAAAIFGEQLIPKIILFNLGVEAAIWSVGVWFLSSCKFRLYGLFNPPIVAIILAVLVREIGGVKLIPPFLWEIISVLSSCAIPVGLLLIGGNFADLLRNFKLSEGVKIEFSAIMVRLFLLPLLFFLGVIYCPIPEGMDWLKKILIIQGSMPAGIFALVIVKHYGQEGTVALQCILASMVVCLITTPIWLYFGVKLLP
tara:strand:+ start:662 stop:1606 length:945 start_codon:yes stop_codon:yes gene_type:complete